MKIHSLQIAINHYHPDSKVSSLTGCENDVRNVTAYLEKRFPNQQINSKKLINKAATYENIVKQFGAAHLLKAEKGDLVFIQYSGHGARELAAPEFKAYASEGKQETWVCYDSRLPGHHDLADKELGALIARIAQKGAQVILLADCCHSGSGTRSLDFQLGKARQWDDRNIVRPLDTYLDGYFVNNVHLPSAKHLLLAACTKRQKAYELLSNQGNFTTHLLKVLKEEKGAISYAQLFSQAKVLMRKLGDEQTAQLEPSGFFNVHTDFLGSESAGGQTSYTCFHEDGNWIVKTGSISGLPTSPGDKAQFEIYDGDTLVGNAESTSISIDTCMVRATVDLDAGKRYQAKLLSLGTTPIYVACDADAAGAEALQEVLKSYQPRYFQLLEAGEKAAYSLILKDAEISIIRQSDGLMVFAHLGYSDNSFEAIFKTLEHICAWEKTLDLENKNALNRRDVEIVLVELDDKRNVLRETSDEEVIIDILKQDRREVAVPFRVEIHNRVAKPFYCALFYLSGSYAAHSMYNEQIPANSSAIVMEYTPNGKPYAFKLNGKNESTDIFKLIASEVKINDALLVQGGIKVGVREKDIGTRDIGHDDEAGFEQNSFNDWFTVTMSCKAVVQQARVGNKDISLSSGVIKIMGNDTGFQANITMESANPGGRSTDAMSVLAKLAHDSEMEVLNLGSAATRSTVAPNVLVLQDIENKEKLKEHPLKIELDIDLQENENILPVTFDGEHILPVGMIEELEGGKTLVTIDEIPDVEQKGRRSLSKAVKLCFLKLALKSKDVQQLCWVDYSQTRVERRTEGIITKVKDATNILMVVHGIIGDTKCIAECMRAAYESGKYDLILTYDYENLNTSIEKTAAALKVKLREAGIHPASGKKISILAHSMGGLVSRYFIEELSGKELVNHLIMAGTPNAGSAISKIIKYRNWAITLLGFAANSAFGLPAAATLLAALKHSKKVTLTLEQMDYDKGDFLKPLNSGDAPGIPYSIVAGHLDRFLEQDESGKRLMNKLLKVGSKMFYGQQSNDIAVSVDSITSIANAWEPKVEEVACHHMNYFDNEESVRIIYGMI